LQPVEIGDRLQTCPTRQDGSIGRDALCPPIGPGWPDEEPGVKRPRLIPLRGKTPVSGRPTVILTMPNDYAQGRLRRVTRIAAIAKRCQARSRVSSGPADHAMRRNPKPTRARMTRSPVNEADSVVGNASRVFLPIAELGVNAGPITASRLRGINAPDDYPGAKECTHLAPRDASHLAERDEYV
jgi:hypothetical protein